MDSLKSRFTTMLEPDKPLTVLDTDKNSFSGSLESPASTSRGSDCSACAVPLASAITCNASGESSPLSSPRSVLFDASGVALVTGGSRLDRTAAIVLNKKSPLGVSGCPLQAAKGGSPFYDVSPRKGQATAAVATLEDEFFISSLLDFPTVTITLCPEASSFQPTSTKATLSSAPPESQMRELKVPLSDSDRGISSRTAIDGVVAKVRGPLGIISSCFRPEASCN